MTPEQIFTKQIQTLRNNLNLRSMEHFALLTIFLGLVLNLIGMTTQQLMGLTWNLGTIALISGVIALLGALTIHWFQKKSFLSELIAIDARLETKDRLSTAYEFLQNASKTEFRGPLFQDASQVLENTNSQQLLPRKQLWLYGAIPLTALILGVLYFNGLGFSLKVTDLSQNEQATVSEQLEKLLHLNRLTSRTATDDRETANQLKGMLEDLQNGQLARKELLDSLEQIKKKTEKKQQTLQDRLKDDLSFGDDASVPQLSEVLPNQQNRNQPDLNKLRDQLEQSFESLPNSINNALKNLEQNQALQDQLEQTLALLEDSEPPPPEDEEDDLEQEGEGSNSSENDELSDEGQQPGEPQTGGDGQDEELAQQEVESLSEITPGGGELDEDSRFDKDKDIRPIGPGSELGSQTETNPDELNQNTGPTQVAKGESGEGNSYSGRVRALSKIGNADLDEQTVVQNYQKQVEDVLTKETIPLKYRNLVKNYFLSIQLIQDQNGNTEPQ